MKKINFVMYLLVFLFTITIGITSLTAGDAASADSWQAGTDSGADDTTGGDELPMPAQDEPIPEVSDTEVSAPDAAPTQPETAPVAQAQSTGADSTANVNDAKMQELSKSYVDVSKKLEDAKSQASNATTEEERKTATALVEQYMAQSESVLKEMKESDVTSRTNRIPTTDQAIDATKEALDKITADLKSAQEKLSQAVTEEGKKQAASLVETATLAKSNAEKEYQSLVGNKDDKIKQIYQEANGIKEMAEGKKQEVVALINSGISEVKDIAKKEADSVGKEIITKTADQIALLQESAANSLNEGVNKTLESIIGGTASGEKIDGAAVNGAIKAVGNSAVNDVSKAIGLPKEITAQGFNLLGSISTCFLSNTQGIKAKVEQALPSMSQKLGMTPKESSQLKNTLSSLFAVMEKSEVSLQGFSGVTVERQKDITTKKIATMETELAKLDPNSTEYKLKKEVLDEHKTILDTTNKILAVTEEKNTIERNLATLKEQSKVTANSDERERINKQIASFQVIYNEHVKNLNVLNEKNTVSTNLIGYKESVVDYSSKLKELESQKPGAVQELEVKTKELALLNEEIAKNGGQVVDASARDALTEKCKLLQSTVDKMNNDIKNYSAYVTEDQKSIAPLEQHKTAIEEIVVAREKNIDIEKTKISHEASLTEIIEKIRISNDDAEKSELTATKSNLENEIQKLDEASVPIAKMVQDKEFEKDNIATGSVASKIAIESAEKGIFGQVFSVVKTVTTSAFGSILGAALRGTKLDVFANNIKDLKQASEEAQEKELQEQQAEEARAARASEMEEERAAEMAEHHR